MRTNFKLFLINFYYWMTFLLSLATLYLSIGLFLYVSSVLLVQLLLLHIYIGIRVNKIYNRNKLIALSATNLLLFTLLRIDGAHTFHLIGYKELLDLAGVRVSYIPELETVFLWITIALFLIQVVVDIYLLNELKKYKEIKI